MSSRTKFIQRFIGAITLTAFLVIFLPILFNKRQYNVDAPKIEKNTVNIPVDNLRKA